ncbi:MAG: hypothetical protein SVY53_13865 [Chloroflexota bacterium]|nr:hypothetical protein [Chloroflexota bacterium]
MFWSTFGTLQIIASWADLKGISFFWQPVSGYAFGILTTLLSFFWFFATDSHVAPNPTARTGEQLVFSALGLLLAAAITFIISSIVKFRMTDDLAHYSDEHYNGISAFRKMTFFQAIKHQTRNKGRDN